MRLCHIRWHSRIIEKPMRRRLKSLVAIFLATLTLYWAAAHRPAIATHDEREVIKAALADPQFPKLCIQPVTNPDQPLNGYGFSNGGSVAGEVWLDRSFLAARGRNATLLADSADEASLMRFVPAPMRSADCRFPVSLNTPVFQGNLAFVGFANQRYFGSIVLERDGAGWKFVSINWESRGPVI